MLQKTYSANGRELILAVAGPRRGINLKGMLADVAREAKITPRMAQSVWYGAIRDPEHRSIRRLEAARDRRARAVPAGFREIAERLRLADEEFHLPTIRALCEMADVADLLLGRLAGTKE